MHHIAGQIEHKRVLMSTAVVYVKTDNGYDYQLRVLLDSASETNFVTTVACKKLGLKLSDVHESINGLNNMNCLIKHAY